MNTLLKYLFMAGIIFSICLACSDDDDDDNNVNPEPKPFEFFISAFDSGQAIPAKFSCEGDDISPAMNWKNAPSGTKSFALIVNDPDAPNGNWVHWVVFNIGKDVNQLPEDTSPGGSLPAGSLHGKNSWGNNKYQGPCPPPGSTHRYFFRLYALDTDLSLSAGASMQDVLNAVDGHVLEEKTIVGTFSR